MMSGAYVLTDTIDKAFDSIFVDSYAGTDAVVTGKDPGFSFEGESAQAPPIPEETLTSVRGVDGVEIATGSVQDFQTKLLRPDGEAIDTGGAPSFAFGIETAPEFDRFNPLNLVEGRWPSGGTEVAIDEGVAGDEDLELGDRIGVAALGPAQEFTIVGIAKYGDLSSIGGATFAIFDVPTAQELLDKEGKLDAVSAAAAEGTTPEQLTQRIQAELGATSPCGRASSRRPRSRARSPPSRRSSATSCSRSRASPSSSARSSSSTRSRSRSRSGCGSSRPCARSARRGARCSGR